MYIVILQNYINVVFYIFESNGDEMLQLCEDLEEVLNKHGLTLITFSDGEAVSEDHEYDGNIVALFDILEDHKSNK